MSRASKPPLIAESSVDQERVDKLHRASPRRCRRFNERFGVYSSFKHFEHESFRSADWRGGDESYCGSRSYGVFSFSQYSRRPRPDDRASRNPAGTRHDRLLSRKRWICRYVQTDKRREDEQRRYRSQKPISLHISDTRSSHGYGRSGQRDSHDDRDSDEDGLDDVSVD